MNDPIKIILKYKNNNKRLQHHMYIFIGNVPKNIMTVLNKIKNTSMYDSLISLDNTDYSRLEKFYSKFWYKKLYNTYHINFTIHNIRKIKQQSNKLTKKYGKKWFDDHIKEHKLSDKKIYYTYSSMIEEEIFRKEMRKKKIIIKSEEEKPINYTTKKKQTIDEMIDVLMLTLKNI